MPPSISKLHATIDTHHGIQPYETHTNENAPGVKNDKQFHTNLYL
jgi:hypothetical protein